MKCFGCGKKIPFSGEVCPYCQRDKKGAQLLITAVLVFGFIGLWIGSAISGPDTSGGLWGGFIGSVIGLTLAGSAGAFKSHPPHVQIYQNTKPDLKKDSPNNLLEDRLAKLNSLKEKGLITEAEFSGKKMDILSSL